MLVDPVAEFGERAVTSDGAVGSCGLEQEATTDTLAEVNAAVITARRSGRNWFVSRTGGVPFREVLAELDQRSAVAFALSNATPAEVVVHGGCSLGFVWRQDGTGRRRCGVCDQRNLVDACIRGAQLRPVQESVCDSSKRVPGVSDHRVDHRWYWAVVGAAWSTGSACEQTLRVAHCARTHEVQSDAGVAQEAARPLQQEFAAVLDLQLVDVVQGIKGQQEVPDHRGLGGGVHHDRARGVVGIEEGAVPHAKKALPKGRELNRPGVSGDLLV